LTARPLCAAAMKSSIAAATVKSSRNRPPSGRGRGRTTMAGVGGGGACRVGPPVVDHACPTRCGWPGRSASMSRSGALKSVHGTTRGRLDPAERQASRSAHVPA
jgi:hypothetical protein